MLARSIDLSHGSAQIDLGPAPGIETGAEPTRASPAPTSLADRLRAGVTTTAILGGLWWLLNPGDHASWLVGAPTVALGAALAALLPRPRPRGVSVFGAIRFATFFLWQSVLGAVDVAWRALDPRLPIDPGFRRVELDLPPGPPMTLFANTVTLLPGTLSAEIDGNHLVVHALDRGADLEGELARLARRVRDLFGMPEEGNPR